MNLNFKILTFPVGMLKTNCYLITDGLNALVVDPGGDGEYLIKKINDKELRLEKILLTHAHFDHMMAADELRLAFGAPLCVTALDADSVTNADHSYMSILGGADKGLDKADILFDDKDTFYFGENEVKVILTPGHTKGSCMYQIGNDVFCGDTVFADGYGRTDLYGGDSRQLSESLSLIKKLYYGKNFRFHPGHGNSFTL